MPQASLLAVAVCIDTFFAALSCSMNGIQIPKRYAFVISLVSMACLGISFALAEIICQFLPEHIFQYIGFVTLLILGLSQLLKQAMTSLFHKHKPHWNWQTLGLVIDIYFDETLADADGSKILNMRETLTYAAAMSADCLASGFASGIAVRHMPFCMGLTFLLGFVFTLSGCQLGKRCHKKSNLSWLGGVILIILGFIRLL